MGDEFTRKNAVYFLCSEKALLLEEHMRELRRVIRPGAKRLNWNSLGITDFVLKCAAVSMRL